jgi:hypothetical protein
MLQDLQKLQNGQEIEEIFATGDMAAIKILENLIKKMNQDKKK